MTTPLLAEVTAACALVHAAEDGPEDPVEPELGTLGTLLVVVDVDVEPLDASIATAALLECTAHAPSRPTS